MIHPIENWRTYDDNSVMMPWYTRPCLEWLDKLLINRICVFEYGCGASSLWYASRFANIQGIDNNQNWLFLPDDDRGGRQCCADNQEKYVRGPLLDFYGTGISKSAIGWYDLVIIDGIYRDDCTEWALKALKKGGYLIADNFEQPSVEPFWPKTRELTKNLPISIYKEPTHPDWQTAVWHNV